MYFFNRKSIFQVPNDYIYTTGQHRLWKLTPSQEIIWVSIALDAKHTKPNKTLYLIKGLQSKI